MDGSNITMSNFRLLSVNHPPSRNLFVLNILTGCSNPNIQNPYRWFSGKIPACHAGAPGSIPGRCRSNNLLLLSGLAILLLPREFWITCISPSSIVIEY
eukprot:scaffold11736_cov159-Ochromonas_danica.AAC.13